MILAGFSIMRELKANLEVEQPGEILNRFRERIDNAKTICVGQFHQHSFDNERIVVSANNSYLTINNTEEYEVSFMKVVDIPVLYQIL